MMTKNSLFKRFVAILLCVTMVFGSVPVTFAAETDGGYDQVSDASTVHEWEDFFGASYDNGSLTTENAGLVWTDKSVYTNENAPKTGGIEIGENNFLVALSAMASNKEIVGYSTNPTDTVFILDVSQSMDNGQYVPSMVTAANDAIEELLKLNKHNRISVILYSSSSQSTVLLPLGRYTASDKVYVRYTGESNATTVATGKNVKNENGSSITHVSKETVGGTYIQSGLYAAYKQFETVYKNNDTVIDSDLLQGGTKRMPIITLMSDGQPTYATTSYTNIGSSTHGNGNTTNNILTFLTQITATWVKANVENWYDTDVKFYSLWLKNKNDNTTNATLQPSASNDSLDSWWKTFLSASKGSNVKLTSGSGDNAVSFTVTRDSFIPRVTGNGWLEWQNYVDKTFDATSNETLKSAFGAIVNEIILQSKYYPTLVESGNYNTDGYITIEDPIGELMEVKQIEGIMLSVDAEDDILFTGKALVDHMINNDFGSGSIKTELGQEFIKAIMERLGVSESEAKQLATQAWNAGQLGLKNGVYSNYIGWYCDDNRNYKGFWQEGHTAADVPSGATKIVKSYGFFGELDEEYKDNNLYGTQMLHVVVHVATDLQDGDQMISFAIPASLVPVMTYSVTVNSNSLATTTDASVKLKGAPGPIRLLAEIGLRDDVNEVTVAEIVVGRDHKHIENGNYVFYTNRWGEEEDFKVTTESILDKSKLAATSHYQPSVQNDRYYYTENAIIYTDTNGTEYKGSSAPANGTFYHIIYRFDNKTDSSTGRKGIHAVYEAIKAETLSAAKKNDDGTWYIPTGTPYREILTEYTLNKTENKTGTLAFVDDMYIYKNETNDTYEAYIFNGNNGKMTIVPAQGIRLTKTVPVVEPGTATNNFVFEVVLTGVTDWESIKVLEEDGKTVKTATVDSANNKITVTLAKDETVYIVGLPAGATYTITEQAHASYVLEGNQALEGTVSANKINDVTAVNNVKQPGHLVISKTVTHPFGADYAIPDDKTFEVKVTFSVPAGNDLRDVVITGLTPGETAVWNGDSVTFYIRDGQNVSIAGLPADTDYEVGESSVPDRFTLDYNVSSGLTGTISSNATSSAALVNDYNPEPISGEDISIIGEKILVGREWKEGDSFTFALSQWDGANFVQSQVTSTATYGDHGFDLSAAMGGITFDKIGDYHFWITEVAASIPGITYDSTYRPFTVTVSDDDMDGKLEIKEVKSSDVRVVINDKDVKVDFTNVYAPEGSASTEVLVLKNIDKAAGVTASLAGFQFAIFEVDGEGNETQVGSAYTTEEDGFAEIKLVYGTDSLNKNESTGYYDSAIYTYRVKEIIPADADKVDGMTYTADYANLEVTIFDNKEGGIEATARFVPVDGDNDSVTDVDFGNIEIAAGTTKQGLIFTNKYELDPAGVTFHGEKTLEGRGINANDKFWFELYETDIKFVTEGQPLEVSKNLVVDGINDHHGKFSFSHIHYSENDIGIHYYVVKEVNAGKTIGGVTYSNTEYHITVAISQEGNTNALKADVTKVVVVDGTAKETENEVLSFTNSYSYSGTTTATLNAAKKLEGRNINEGEFTVEITDETGKTVEIQNSGASFSHTFEYDKPGEYRYTVKEKAGTLGGIIYDDSEYVFGVFVYDNGLGELESESWIEDSEGNVVENLVFENKYSPAAANVTISGKKVLEGKELVDGQFTFTAYPTDENYTVAEGTAAYATVTNIDGKFAFNFNFDKAGDYYYVIYEDDSNPIKNIDYDESEYQVHISVYDNGGNGKLLHDVKVNGVVDGDITFTNVYERPVSDKKLTVEKVWKDNNDKEGARPDSVTVVLYADGVRIDRAVLSEANGWTYTFENLSRTNENGRNIKYTVVEENVPKNYAASYNTTWLGKVIVTNTYVEEENPATGAPGLD